MHDPAPHGHGIAIDALGAHLRPGLLTELVQPLLELHPDVVERRENLAVREAFDRRGPKPQRAEQGRIGG